jgi:triosephosphate isomerase (TIM)
MRGPRFSAAADGAAKRGGIVEAADAPQARRSHPCRREEIAASVSPFRPLIAGNWKMNGLTGDLDAAADLAARLEERVPAARVALCPPATLIMDMARRLAGRGVEVGAQDCRAERAGAFTGDLSPEMLADAGARLVILGHSERRTYHGETDADVAAKVEGALRAGLEPIVCVGEHQAQRDAGAAVDVVAGQVRASLPPALAGRSFCVAYEPVWAIGSGRTPTVEQIAEVHQVIRRNLREMFGEAGASAPVLYGGSVKPQNAREVFTAAEVGGALVGGASLSAADFAAIIGAF